jgi:putative transposase
MKYNFIQKYSQEFTVQRICQVLKINRSGYYAWLNRKPSSRDLENSLILERIKYFHKSSNRIYGYRKIHEDLINDGFKCSQKRVSRLMSANGIYSIIKRKFKETTNSKHNYPISKNLLSRNFKFEDRDKAWVSDITYIPTSKGWLYLCIVMDLFSRTIVGWSMQNNMKTELVIDAFNMAYEKRKPGKGLIFHSDRGVQYASHKFRNLLKSKKCISSMSRKGDCWDNACAESFFHSLKSEEVYLKKYKTREDAKRSIFYYIEVFYNRQRRHSFLNYLSPVNFEMGKMA